MNKSKIPILLFIIGILAIMTAVGIFLYTRMFSAPKKELLPSTLGGLPLNQAIYGTEAVKGVIQLHGVDFPMENAAIGQYSDHNQITLWVSVESNIAAATELTNLMTEKISMGRSPFTLPVVEELNGTQVYRLEGLGQQHYYWQTGNLIIWIAVDFSFSEEVLVETLRFYR